MKYKIGDVVKVRDDLENGKFYGNDSIVPNMLFLSGKTTKIVGIQPLTGNLKLEGCEYYWFTPEMLDEQVPDAVNHPTHYQGKVEVIDVIEDKLTAEEFCGFLKGNVIKYTLRAGKKDDTVQDLKKAKWYLERLIARVEE